MTTIKTTLNERPATDTPFAPTSSIAESNVQDAIEAVSSTAAADLSAHVAAADPHPGYLLESAVSAYGLTLIDDADAATARNTLGLGTLATQNGTFSGTSSGTNTGDQNLFSTIAVATQSNVVADSTSDTLTLAAGSNITITTDASTDTITIASTASGVSDGDKGDITVSGSGATWTVDNNAITDAKIRDSAALSVIGRSANSTGDPADIAAASDGQVLRRSGTALGFGAVDLASANAITGTLPVGNGGTGQTTAAEAVGELIQACTEDTAPDNAADFFGVYDASADTGSKVKMSTVIREKLSAARTYYVRTDGSDSNTGLANTSGGAFLTIQKAVDVAASLDLVTYDVTIQVADGTYTGAIVLKTLTGSGSVTIQGNSGTPANVLINPTSPSSGAAIYGEKILSTYTVKDLEIRTTTSGHGINIEGPGLVKISNIRCGVKGGTAAHLRTVGGGEIRATGSYTVSGNASFHVLTGYLGFIILGSGITVTYSGTPAFATANAYADALSYINAAGTTQSGSATGPRYFVQQNGVINTAGGGANFFPGNVAGSTATGGQYA